jgi:hypothetical protein
MNRRVRLSELLGDAEADEGKSLRIGRGPRNDEWHERTGKGPRAGSEREPATEQQMIAATKRNAAGPARAATGEMGKNHRIGAREAVAEARVERSHRRGASPLSGAGTMTYGAELDASGAAKGDRSERHRRH